MVVDISPCSARTCHAVDSLQPAIRSHRAAATPPSDTDARRRLLQLVQHWRRSHQTDQRSSLQSSCPHRYMSHGCDMMGPYFHAGVDAPRSITSVLCFEGLPPPMMNTRGSELLVGVGASDTEVRYVRVPL